MKKLIVCVMSFMTLFSFAQKAPDYLNDPHLSAGTKEYLKVLNASSTPVESLGVQGARNVLINAQQAVRVDLSGITESERTISYEGYTVKLNIVRPEDKNGKLPCFIFIHGGGWVLGDYPTHKRLVRDLVVESGFAAVFVNYTPSPEAKYPQAINEIFAATKWVALNGDDINVDGSKMAIVGNSVGGNMTMVTTLRATENKFPNIKCQILMWPVTDASKDWESWRMYGQQRFLTSSLMSWMWDNYTTDPAALNSRYVSPLRATTAQLRGIPPTLIQVAENDILRDQGEALGRKLDEAGVWVSTVRYNGVTHDWGLLNGFAELPQTKTLIMLAAEMLKTYLKYEEDYNTDIF